MAVTLTIVGIAVPLTSEALDEIRTGMAARYLAARINDARVQALRRSSCVALQFSPADGDYRFGEYADGNANGVRTAEIAAGIDAELAPRRQLRHHFPGVSFGLLPDLPDADGTRSSGTDGVRVGTSRILTMAPDGTSSSGTLYVRGRRAQYAVRVLGATGRTRMLRFERGGRQWLSR
jgi:hypothetical protein